MTYVSDEDKNKFAVHAMKRIADEAIENIHLAMSAVLLLSDEHALVKCGGLVLCVRDALEQGVEQTRSVAGKPAQELCEALALVDGVQQALSQLSARWITASIENGDLNYEVSIEKLKDGFELPEANATMTEEEFKEAFGCSPEEMLGLDEE